MERTYRPWRRRLRHDRGVADDVEAQIDELYRLPPDEFVAERDRLARAVRAAGDRERAQEISGQRRPTLAAWALDQLRDRDPEGLDRLAEVGDALRREQERALAGDRDADLRGAGRDRRAVIGRLAGEAVAALREIGRAAEQQLDTVNAVLAAAIADPELLQRIRAGRLVSDEVPAPSGLDDPFAVFATGAAPAAKVGRARKAAKPAEAKPAGKPAKAKARAAAKAPPSRPDPRLERARAAAESADAALDEAESAASRAADEARRAKRRVEELERELSRARREADKQVAAAAKARNALAGAGRKRAQAHGALQKVLDRRPPGREE
jgi:hypothetical protein